MKGSDAATAFSLAPEVAEHGRFFARLLARRARLFPIGGTAAGHTPLPQRVKTCPEDGGKSPPCQVGGGRMPQNPDQERHRKRSGRKINDGLSDGRTPAASWVGGRWRPIPRSIPETEMNRLLSLGDCRGGRPAGLRCHRRHVLAAGLPSADVEGYRLVGDRCFHRDDGRLPGNGSRQHGLGRPVRPFRPATVVLAGSVILAAAWRWPAAPAR